MQAPCNKCPFRRDSSPGYLGGANPFVYVGQTEGPFVLNCHQAAGYCQKETDVLNVEQCAGAAIYRSNLGLDALLPEAIKYLPPDREVVFANHEEFLAHHTRVPVSVAQAFFRRVDPKMFLQLELEDAQAREVKVER